MSIINISISNDGINVNTSKPLGVQAEWQKGERELQIRNSKKIIQHKTEFARFPSSKKSSQ